MRSLEPDALRGAALRRSGTRRPHALADTGIVSRSPCRAQVEHEPALALGDAAARLGSRSLACLTLALGLVLAEDVAHRAADLADRARGPCSAARIGGQQVLVAAGGLAQLLEALVDQLLVAVRLERLQALDLRALGLGVDAQDVLDLGVLLDVLVDADDDVLLGAVALVVAEGGLLDLALDERDRVDRAAQLVDLARSAPRARRSISAVSAST